MSRAALHRCLTSGIAVLALSCTGIVGGGAGESGPNGFGRPGEPGSGTGTGIGNETGGSATVASGPTLRLLTAAQYRATLRSLFPFADELVLDLQEDVALNGLRSIGAATVALSARATETYQKIAETAAARAFGDLASAGEFTGCDVAALACAQGFIADFGRRAFRRSLSSDEQARYEALYQAGMTQLGDGAAALRYVVTAMLGSPHFLYRVELGEPDPAVTSQRLLTNVEVGSKLAYLLWDGPPDAELLDLAESTDLRGAVMLRQQAERLLASPRAQAGVQSFFRDYLNLPALDSISKLSSAFPTFSASLVSAMQQQTLLDVTELAEPGRDFRQFFNATTSFVNGELADLYGIVGVAGPEFRQASLPAPRRGLLGQASLLSLYAHDSATSPTLRGKFVRTVLLCEGVPAPPPDVDTTLPDTSVAATTREKFTIHRTNPSCAGCHKLMDPVGLGLENFDAIGAYRAEENGIQIDASGDLDGVAFSDAAGLADALAGHPSVPGCLARTLLRYATGRLEADSDEPFIGALSSSFEASGFQLRELLLHAVIEPDFYEVGLLD